MYWAFQNSLINVAQTITNPSNGSHQIYALFNLKFGNIHVQMSKIAVLTHFSFHLGRMKLLKCTWILWTFALCSAYATKEICNVKPKDMPLGPMCVYRNPDFSVEPTREPEKIQVNANPRVLELSKANSGFALTLFKQLSERKSSSENIFLSPLSISTAFAMTKLGACNRTLEQLMKVRCQLRHTNKMRFQWTEVKRNLYFY